MDCCRKIQSNIRRPDQYKYAYLTMLRRWHKLPFLDFYYKTTGNKASPISIKKHPYIENLTNDRIECTLAILKKFGITPLESCQYLHVFSMNPITMDNYAEILRECGFINILPQYLIRYHTLVRSRTIEYLKKKGFMHSDIILEETLQNCFPEWPSESKSIKKFLDLNTCILTVRMSVLEKYLHWRISVSSEEFNKYCRNYLPLKHKPMSDIREALDIAQNNIKFSIETIKRNGFIISSDPVKTKLLLENVTSLAGLEIREAIKIEPAILKNNYMAVLRIRDILEDFRISEEAQQRYLKVYCMKPETVQRRLDELKSLREYEVLFTNPRALSMVIHKKKAMLRLDKIQEAKKECYSLNVLVASSKVFNNYIGSFGNKVCSRDIAMLIKSYIIADNDISKSSESEIVKTIMEQLKRHKYYLHAALSVVDENIKFLKTKFANNDIFNNCQLLLYPLSEIEHFVSHLLDLRNNETEIPKETYQLDATYINLKYSQLTDSQILSLVLYEIEKKYHFSGDGIWAKQDGLKAEASIS